MRDMSQVLERWAGWARSEHSGVDYSTIAAGFKGLLPQSSKMTYSCSDDDGLTIERCITRLRIRKYDEFYVLILYYYYGLSKRSIARKLNKDEKTIRIQVQMAEGFIDGCLSMMDVKLEM